MRATPASLRAARASARSVDPASAAALAEAFFDALGHFAGEGPALEDLSRVLAPEAEIFEGSDEDGPGVVRYVRDAWLAQLARRSTTQRTRHGHFFEEVARTMTAYAPEMHVGSVVEERITSGGAVEHVETLLCALLVARVGEQAAIVHVRVRRNNPPAAH